MDELGAYKDGVKSISILIVFGYFRIIVSDLVEDTIL